MIILAQDNILTNPKQDAIILSHDENEGSQMHRLNRADDHDLPPAIHPPLADLNGKVCVLY